MKKELFERILDLSGIPLQEMAALKTLRDIKYVSDSELKKILKDVLEYKALSQKEKEVHKVRKVARAKRYSAIIHPSIIKSVKKGKSFDLEELKNIITEHPGNIVVTSSKMKHSRSGIFYKISLPSASGLVYDKEEEKWGFVTTCPFAGACLAGCYDCNSKERLANYMLSTTRTLNLLLNEPEQFKKFISAEVYLLNTKARDKQLYIRWHDAGDFFSDRYVDLVLDIARDFPDVNFYAYTKSHTMLDKKDLPDNFLLNLSTGGTKDDLIKDRKNALVLMKKDFADIIRANDEKAYERKMTPEKVLQLKQRISEIFPEIPNDNNLLTYDEFMEQKTILKPDENMKYNVIVWQGHGDDTATREDVKTTILLQH